MPTCLGNKRFKFVSVTEKLGLTPDEDIIIAPDGTHFQWNWGQLPISDSHVGLLKTIFSHYCYYRE